VSVELFQPAIHPDDLQKVSQSIALAHSPGGDGRYSLQHRILHPDGTIHWVDTRSQTVFEGEGTARHAVRTVGAMVDITARVEAEEALRHSLHEKETLLREVHHRVKNNLQIIASLLHFQAKKVRDPEDLAAFSEGRNRLRSMILVHEKLYQSRDLSRIDFGSYIRALARDLQRSYLTTGRNVGVRVTADTFALPIESAVPCGMILCELLTNVFKYAFPDGRSGTADVSVTAADGHMHLNVSDDGVGLPQDFDPEHSTSFGWQLIRNLTAQLGGTAEIVRGDGTQVAISFPRGPVPS
jgi:two-component sensor histidine kinase